MLYGEKPNRSVTISTFLITLGALIASSETLERDMAGFICVWATNFSQSMQNLYIAKLNENKVISTFGKS